MVKYDDTQLDRLFGALSDPTRRAMLERLAKGTASVGDLGRPFGMTAPAISKHLRVLERAGLVTQQRDGRIRRCHLEADPLQDAALWVAQYRHFWTKQLDRLESYLSKVPAEPTARRKRTSRSTKKG